MNAWKHFKTITKHKILVMDGCFRVGLYKQGLLRDLSNEELGELMRAVVEYALENELPTFRFPAAEVYWLLLLRDMQRHEDLEQLRQDCCLLRRDPEAARIMRAVRES